MKFMSSFLLLALTAGAQTPQKPPIMPATPPVASLTELESTKLELLSTQNLLLRRQEDDLRAKFNALVEAINQNHPGYVLNQQTGQLQPIPAPPVSPKPEAKK